MKIILSAIKTSNQKIVEPHQHLIGKSRPEWNQQEANLSNQLVLD